MWYEIKIKTQTNALEAIYPILFDYKLDGIVTEDPNDPIYSEGYPGDWDYFGEDVCSFEYDGALVKGYVESDNVDKLTKNIQQKIIALKNYGFDPLPALVTFSQVKDEDWVNEWKQHYHTFQIAEGIIIKPAWEDCDTYANDIVVTLDPGRAFGTGTHETTTLCARFIKKYSADKDRLYDIGCGSGILSIIAKYLGYQTVIGVDIDAAAISASKENAKLNFDSNQAILYSTKPIDELTDQPADMIVANIIADVIVDMAASFKLYVKENGVLITSGILLDQANRVQKELKKVGFECIEKAEKGEWCAVVFKRYSSKRQ